MVTGGNNGSFAFPEKGNAPVICHNPLMTTSGGGVWSGEDPLSESLPLIMLQISLMFVATRTVYFLLSPLKQPRVVSDVIGGIILGPSVLGRWKGFAAKVHPASGYNLLRTTAAFGIIYFLFLIGVKTDVKLIAKTRKESLAIGVVGMLLPLAVVSTASFTVHRFIEADIAKGLLPLFMAASISITASPVLAQLLAEYRLLSSEVGQFALYVAVITDAFGWFFIALFTGVVQWQRAPKMSFWAMSSMMAMVSFVLFVFRPWTQWIIEHTPKGGRVAEGYVVAILICVIASGFVSDMIGGSMVFGPFLMGLALPEGPPLGTAIVEKVDAVITGMLMPLCYMMSGLIVDLSVFAEWRRWAALLIIMFLGFLAKLLGTMLPSLYFSFPLRKAFLLGLIMNFRGTVEVLTFMQFKNGGILDNKSYTVMLLTALLMTAISAPLAAILYKPQCRRDSEKSTGRTLQQSSNDTELRILTCVHDQDPVPAIINLLEVAHATEASPICVYPLRLHELVGRTAPMLISHRSDDSFNHRHLASTDPVVKAFIKYEQQNEGRILVLPFTTIAPYTTMHEDICRLAQTKNVTLVVVPFRRKDAAEDDEITRTDQALRTMTPNILANSPCSVGILIHSGMSNVNTTIISSTTLYRVAVLFWGGPDDREALSFASRIASHQGVRLTVVKFISSEDTVACDKEWLLDDEAVSAFRSSNAGNDRVVLEELEVKDVEETIAVIWSMSDIYDLLVIGRQQGSGGSLLGLSDWSECPELGVLGDMLASSDFKSTVTVLVLHQHP